MADAQLGLFGAEPARGNSAVTAPEPEPCLLGHSAAYICPACAESGDTDGCGFLHRQVCKGRIPLRACRGCGKLATHGGWNHADYFHCLACVPLGSKKDQRRA